MPPLESIEPPRGCSAVVPERRVPIRAAARCRASPGDPLAVAAWLSGHAERKPFLYLGAERQEPVASAVRSRGRAGLPSRGPLSRLCSVVEEQAAPSSRQGAPSSRFVRRYATLTIASQLGAQRTHGREAPPQPSARR